MTWLIRFVANTVGLAVAAWLLPDISIRGATDQDRLVAGGSVVALVTWGVTALVPEPEPVHR